MKTAADAYRESKKISDMDDLITEEINFAISKGKFSCEIHENELPYYYRAKLRDLGYTVVCIPYSYSKDMEGNIWQVSWEESEEENENKTL